MALYGDLTEAYFAATTDRYRTPEEENGELNARLQTCLTEKAKWERLAEDWERYGTNAEAKIKSLEAENERLQSIVSDQGARIQAGDFQMQSKDRRIQSYVNDLNKLRMSIDEDRKSFKKLLEESESKNSSLMDRLNASSSNYEKLVSDAENKDEENSRLRSQINELTRENKRLAKANEEQRDLANKQEEKISSLRQKIDKSITAGRSEQLVREVEVLKETVARLAAEIKEGEVDLGDPDLNECIDDFEKMKYFVLSQIEIQNQIHEALLDAFKRQ
jgi:chromosome segregation ATPase